MSTVIGNKAEDTAAQYLKKHKYKIVAQNWKTPVCEIDIIAKKQKVLYFVEVKYRKNQLQGTGLDYITNKKLAQMQFAARCYVEEVDYTGAYELSAIEVTGRDFSVTRFLPHIV